MWWRGAAALYCVALVRGDALVEFNYDNTMMVGQDSTEFNQGLTGRGPLPYA